MLVRDIGDTVKGLMNCVIEPPDCVLCPYKDAGCKEELMRDAVCWLRKHEHAEKPAHVITCADFVYNPLKDIMGYIPVWAETFDGLPGYWCFIDKEHCGNPGCRYWNKQPTQNDIDRVNERDADE